MVENRFGDIRIHAGAPEEAKEENIPLSGNSETDRKDPAIEQQSTEADTDKTPPDYRRKSRTRRGRPPFFSRRAMAWLSVIPLLAIFYGVGSYFLVPILINGVLVSNFSREIQRPVETGRVVFSPFTLELFVDDVTIGAVHGDTTGGQLLAAEKARFAFSLARILDGKVVCRQAALEGISVDLIRRPETTFDLKRVADLLLNRSPGHDVRYWPAWLLLDELEITSGRIRIDDRPANKIYSIENIRFYLPSSDTRDRDNAAMPKLTASLDSSPFEINAVRFRNQAGAWRTGFIFAFNNLLLNNFKELFPLPDTGLQLSDGEADINLKVILPERDIGLQSIVVEGEAELRNARWQDHDAQAVLLLPQARIVYRVVPADKLFTLTSVEFHEPEISLAGKDDPAAGELPAILTYPLSLLDTLSRAQEPLEVEHFLWDNGKISRTINGAVQHETIFNDVVFSIKGFSSSGYRRAHPDAVEPALYSFRAKDISSKPETDFTSQGTYSADSVLKGTLEITGLDLSRHQALLPDSSLRLQKAMADISFHYRYARQPEAEAGPAEPARQNKIFNGRFKATSFVLGRNNAKAVAGEMMVCSDFHFDALSKTIVCDHLELSNSEIFAVPLFGRQDPDTADAADSRRFIVNNLQVGGSTVHTLLPGDDGTGKGNDLVMRNVTLEGTNLQAEKGADNIKASAEIGKKAKLSINGGYSTLTGNGTLQVALQDMELARLHPYFSSWFVPRINSGLFFASGSVRLPDRVFQGNIRVDDLDAGEQGRGVITWQRAVSPDCTYRAQTMVLEMDELIIERPSVLPGLSNGERPVEKYIHLQDDALPSFLRIGAVSVEDGVYGLSEPILFPGFQPLLQNINGTFSLADADRLHFLVNGNIGGEGGFRLQGTGSFHDVDSYDLQAWDFPLRPFDVILRKEVGLNGHGTTASWSLEKVKGENGKKMAARIAVHGVIPESGGSTVSALALILDENRRLVMEMEEEYSADQPQPFLLQQLINRLRHQEVKASISPFLVLKSSLPSLDLPEWAPFEPGSAVVDESVALSGYQELLRMRPFISLRLQGQYDPVADERVLRAELQEEADRQREIENKRRALEKIKIRQREKKRLEELKAGSPGVVAEEIPTSELNGDMLQPLPRVLIELDPSILEDLARQRAEGLYAYFVNNLELDPARIILAPAVLKGGSGVSIAVGPYMPPKKDEDDF